MYNVNDFIVFALTHADRDSIVKSASLPIPVAECGTEPWHYLYGTVRRQTTKDALDERFKNHYSKSMTRAKFDSYTKGWKPTDYATDCQGLLDAYLTYECNEKTDWNADYNYKYVCESKGEINKIDRPYVIGEALFMQSDSSGKMTHIGWVCGFLPDGEPLVVEARGIAHGVVVTKFNTRSWTHRGLMTKKFDYTAPQSPQSEPIKLELKSPMMQGDYVLLTQKALNALHYTDSDGKPLEEDGKCGRRTMEAVKAFATAHAETVTTMPPIIGQLDLEAYGLTVGVFRLEDMQGGES